MIYILYLVSLAAGITSIVGVIMAYLNIGKGAKWLDAHFRYQIRTFWLCLVYSVISFLLTFIFIGFLLLIVTLVWYIIRNVKGMQALQRKQEPANIESYWF